MSNYTRHFYPSACGRLDLFARVYPGEGPPLLLLHGLTRNSADFEPLVAWLGHRHELIVPDQRGRGLSASDPQPDNYRVDVYAGDMFALLDGLGIAKAGIIGTSMGGLMAMVMATMQPQAIGPVVLNDIGPELDPAGLARIAGYVGPATPMASWDEAAARCAAINADAFPGFAPDNWLAFARRTCRQLADGTVEFAYDPAIAEGFASGNVAIQPDLWPLWAALANHPVLAIRGALSDLLAPATLVRMGKEHQGPFAAVQVSGRGHAPLLDEAEAKVAIGKFLAAHWPAASA